MAAIAITAANVVKSTGALVENGVAGATITAGQVVYKDTTTGKFALADADGASANIKDGKGIALNGASLNQPLSVQTDGDITIGGTVVPGTAYVVGTTPGAINPIADLVSTNNVCLLGVAVSASVIRLSVKNFAVAI
jgi:hypothetical protein